MTHGRVGLELGLSPCVEHRARPPVGSRASSRALRRRSTRVPAGMISKRTKRTNDANLPDVSDPKHGPAAAAAAPTRQKRDRNAMRIPRYSGDAPPEPVELHRAHSIPGGELLTHDFDHAGPELDVEPGLSGDVERALGRADAQAALELVQASSAASDVLRRSTQARVALMAGSLDDARVALGPDRDSDVYAVADVALSLAEGDVDRAERRLADAMFLKPRGVAEQHLRALVKAARGEISEAAESLNAVARAMPMHAVARFQLGQIVLATGDAARAGTLFEMASQLQPSFIAPVLALAELLFESRQYSEALNLAAKACDAVPEALAPRLLQLRVLLEVGERETALRMSTALYGRVSDDPELGVIHAEALAENERTDDARQILDEVASRPDLDTRVLERVQRQRARLALAEQPPRGDEAIRILRETIEARGPAWPEISIELCHVCIALGRKKDAEQALAMLVDCSETSSVVSGAALARSHGLWSTARALGTHAKTLLKASTAVAQIDAFLESLPS